MSNRISDIGRMRNKISAEERPGIFDGKKTARLGTEKNPAIVTVQTEKRRKEVTAAFEKNGWNYKIELDPGKPEDVGDLTRLLAPPKPTVAEKKIGRNEPCPCGSGKKFKSCCGQ
jgi:SWIM/SEC-C metal-binding protein